MKSSDTRRMSHYSLHEVMPYSPKGTLHTLTPIPDLGPIDCYHLGRKNKNCDEEHT